MENFDFWKACLAYTRMPEHATVAKRRADERRLSRFSPNRSPRSPKPRVSSSVADGERKESRSIDTRSLEPQPTTSLEPGALDARPSVNDGRTASFEPRASMADRKPSPEKDEKPQPSTEEKTSAITTQPTKKNSFLIAVTPSKTSPQTMQWPTTTPLKVEEERVSLLTELPLPPPPPGELYADELSVLERCQAIYDEYLDPNGVHQATFLPRFRFVVP